MNAMIQLQAVFQAVLLLGVSAACLAQAGQKPDKQDEHVRQFLQESRQKWCDLNVPYEDGQVLHDLIVANNYQSALEIGTSTGHSTVWLAWALRKTGGKLITIEIDAKRQEEAIRNVKAAGLSDVVDFRLGDAHAIVKELGGPFDFVFSDADKNWYVQYFKDLDPKLKKGGTFTAHNVLQHISGIREYLDYVNGLKQYETTIDRTSSSGIAVSRKKM